jgi:hypothetical protein
MDERHVQALSRFFDGEPVDPPLLVESLANPEAANYLAHWAALRAWVREDNSRPSARFYAVMASVLKPTPARRAFWGRWVGRGIAASLILLAGLTGFRLGIGVGSDRTPEPARMRTVEDAAASRHSGASPSLVPPAPPPDIRRPPERRVRGSEDWPVASTRLRFESWRETRRGGED